MSIGFLILTIVFIIVSTVMILIILVQRPQGGGLAGAFGGAGGGGTDTVFGGRVGDALTVMTVIAFLAYLGLAIGLNLVPIRSVAVAPTPAPVVTDGTNTLEMTPTDPPPGFEQVPPLDVPAAAPTPVVPDETGAVTDEADDAPSAADVPAEEIPAEIPDENSAGGA